jgi:hypothetical protein
MPSLFTSNSAMASGSDTIMSADSKSSNIAPLDRAASCCVDPRMQSGIARARQAAQL